MSRTDLDPDLRRLGEALRAATTIDLARETDARRQDPSGSVNPRRGWRARLRPRALAGTSLGLAAIAAALLLAFGGGAGSAPSTAQAVTVTREADGSVLVNINTHSFIFVQAANDKLAALGLDERILVGWYPGPAPVKGSVACVPQGKPAGPPVRVLLNGDGTAYFGTANTGAGATAGAVHVGCESFPAPAKSAPGLPGASADAGHSSAARTSGG